MKKTSYFSLLWANEMPGRVENGPNFQKVVSLLDTSGIDAAEFDSRWIDLRQATRSVTFWKGAETEPRYREFDFDFMKMLQSDCVGPISFDEASDWVAMSFLCPSKGDYAILDEISFSNSPELTVTIGFDGDKLTSAKAMEPLVYPGRGLFPMDAYESFKEYKRERGEED